MKRLCNGIICLLLAVSTLLTSCDEQKDNSINLFYDGLVAVKKDNKYAYLNTKGEIVIDFIYDDASNFKNGSAVTRIGNKYSLINKEGKSIIDEKYDYMRLDEETGLVWYTKNNYLGLMDNKGKILSDAVYNSITIPHFSDGMAKIYNGNKYGFINTSGDLVIEPSFEHVEDFNDGYAAFYSQDAETDGLCGYIDKEGDKVINPTYKECLSFRNNQAVVAIRSNITTNYKVIDKAGNDITAEYAAITRSKTRYLVKSGYQQYFILDNKGEKVVDKTYEMLVSNDDRDYIASLNGDEIGQVLNENGELMFEVEVQKPSKNGIFMDENMNLYKVTYNTGSMTIKGKDSEFTIKSNGKADHKVNNKVVVELDGKFGVYDTKGNKIIDKVYDSINLFSDGYAVVKVDNKYGIMDYNGNYVTLTDYDRIIFEYMVLY